MNRRVNKFFSSQNTPFVCCIEFFTVTVLHSRGHKLPVFLARNFLLYSEMPKHRIDIDYPSRFQSEISPMSAILVLLRLIYHLCAHWIKMDIPNQLAQIPIALTENRFMSALQQMPHSS